MARGMFLGKPRPPATDDISSPVFNYTDAFPRNDLREVRRGAKSGRPVHQKQWDFHRPMTSDGQQQQKKARAPGQDFDFRINIPAPEAASTEPDKGLNDSMIGIALGSPRLVESQNIMSQMQEKAIQAKSTAPKASKQQAMQRKPSKWRKIGGLFRAKTAMTPAKQPFYQVRLSTEWPSQGSTHSIDYQFRPNESKSHIQCALETNPISNTEVWPCLASGQAQQSDGGQSLGRGAKQAGDTESLLAVDIPDVQMERYSVMFSGLLTREPSRKRRSKTLEDVRPANTVERSTSPELRPPPRRQTTETARSRSKSPSFSLFPSVQPNRTSKVPGFTLPREPSPLHRSQSSLLESHRENLPNPPRQPSPTMRSSPQKAPVSHKAQFSESSILTFTSLEEGDDKIILQGVKPVQNLKDEPTWEFIQKNPTPTNKQEIGATLKVNTQELPPPDSEDINSAASSPILSPLSGVTVNKMTSPSEGSKPAISPSGSSKPGISPAGSARMPLADDNDSDNEDLKVDFDLDKDTEALNPEQLPIPKVEVSIARSVSVSRGKKQIIVPIGPRTDRLNPDERLVDRKARMVRVTDGQHGHRHGNSQDVRIEMA